MCYKMFFSLFRILPSYADVFPRSVVSRRFSPGSVSADAPKWPSRPPTSSRTSSADGSTSSLIWAPTKSWTTSSSHSTLGTYVKNKVYIEKKKGYLFFFRLLSHFKTAFVPRGEKPLLGPRAYQRDKQVAIMGRKNVISKRYLVSCLNKVMDWSASKSFALILLHRAAYILFPLILIHPEKSS